MIAAEDLDRSTDARLPLYQRVAEDLKAAIVRNGWRPGDRLPSESDIAGRYGIAPGTARMAISQLVEEGLLDRRHGSGTFVRKPSFDASLFRFFRFQAEDGERRIPESCILDREILPAPDSVAAALGLDPGAPAVTVSRLRVIESLPVLSEEIWLDAAVFADFATMDPDEIGPLLYPIYDTHFDRVVARAQERLTVEAVDAVHAHLLKLDSGDPVIVIERLAFGFDGAPIEWRRSWGRADRFQYHIEIN